MVHTTIAYAVQGWGHKKVQGLPKLPSTVRTSLFLLAGPYCNPVRGNREGGAIVGVEVR